MRKKILAALLSACLMLGLTVSAYASEPIPDNSGDAKRLPMEDSVIYPVLPAGTFAEIYGTMPEAPAGRPKARAATNNVYRADYYGAQLAQIYGNNYSTDGYKALVSKQSTPNGNDTTVTYTNPIKATSEAIVNKYVDETLGGFEPYIADYPGFFWDNGGISTDGFSYYLGDNINTLTLLTSEWIGNETNVDYDTVTEAQDDVDALKNVTTAIRDSIPAEASDYEKLAYFNYVLVDAITYDDSTADGTNPSRRGFNATGALLDGSAVCDGYAKAFKMLCDAVNIPCIRVSGTGFTGNGGGNHAWNYVQLKGNWYAVDTTWNDAGDSSYQWDYFLVGSNSKSGTETNFIDSHVPNMLEDINGNDIVYPYQVPTLSKTAYQPTDSEAATFTIQTSKTGNGTISPENPKVVALQSQKITMKAPAGNFVYSITADADIYYPAVYDDGMSSSLTFKNVQEDHTLHAEFRPIEGNKKINVTTKVTGGIGTIEAGSFIPKDMGYGCFFPMPSSGYEVLPENIRITAIVNGKEIVLPVLNVSGYPGYEAIGDTTIEVKFTKSGEPEEPDYKTPVYTADDDTTVMLTIPTANGSLSANTSLTPVSGTEESDKAQTKAGKKPIIAAYEINLTNTADGSDVHKLNKAITVTLEGLNLDDSSYYVVGVHEDGSVTEHKATMPTPNPTGKLSFTSSQFSSFYVVKGTLPQNSSPSYSGGSGSGFSTYSINAKAGEGGTISPAGEIRVTALTDKTYTVTPNAGYEVNKVLIDGTKEVSLTNNTYTFKNVNEPYTIEVTFKKTGAVTAPETSVQLPVVANPATGDNTPINAFWALMGVAGIFLAASIRMLKAK